MKMKSLLKRISGILTSKDFILSLAITGCIILGVSTIALALHNKNKTNHSNVTTSSPTQSTEAISQTNNQGQDSTNSNSSTSSTPVPSTGSSQAADYQKQANAAKEKANKEAACLNTDELAYSTFKHAQDYAYSYTVSQSNSILADNTLTLSQKNTMLAQIHADYNNTVDTAYAKYTSTVTKAGCQPTASPPSHWSGT